MPEATSPGPSRFEQPQWSLVLATGAADGSGADAALAELCLPYWYPLYAFFRTFLLASLQHILANEWDKRRTKKRGGGIVFVLSWSHGRAR